MIQMSLIRCPCCGKMVKCLDFWKTVGTVYFHVCKECLDTAPFTNNQLLRIGYYKGVDNTKSIINKEISEIKFPDVFEESEVRKNSIHKLEDDMSTEMLAEAQQYLDKEGKYKP